MSDKAKLTYILSASHSGSTLLAMLLGAHPEVCTAGELKLSRRAIGDVRRYRCSCRKFIPECPFWTNVRDSMARRGFDFDIADAHTDYMAPPGRYACRLLRPLHRGAVAEWLRDAALSLSPAWHKHLPEVQERNAALVRTLLEISGAKVVVDSSKVAVRLKYLLHNSDLDVKVVRLIRDGRGVAQTYMDPANFADCRDKSMRGGGTGGDRAAERLTTAQAAHQWRRSNEEAQNVLAGLDRSQWLDVRYEQLCADTRLTLRGIFTFLGVDPALAPKDFRGVPQHVVGNGMRLDATSEVSLDERWRSSLSHEDLLMFDSIAGDMNRRYGYV